ncbi:hypothetical protein D3C72_1598090 [compost metagenome]
MRHHGGARRGVDLVAAGHPEAEFFLHPQRSGIIRKHAGMKGHARHAAEEPLDHAGHRLGHVTLAPVEAVEPVAEMPLAVPQFHRNDADQGIVATGNGEIPVGQGA